MIVPANQYIPYDEMVEVSTGMEFEVMFISHVLNRLTVFLLASTRLSSDSLEMLTVCEFYKGWW